MKSDQLVVYRGLEHRDLFDGVASLLEGEGNLAKEGGPTPCGLAGGLVELAAAHGFEGNLWHCFLAWAMARNENPYSMACEIKGRAEGTLKQLARQDFQVLKGLFDQDISRLDQAGQPLWALLADYHLAGSSQAFNKRIQGQIQAFARELGQAGDVEEFQAVATGFYQRLGVGKFGLNKAFRIREEAGQVAIEPIPNVEHVYLDDMIGYQLQKEKLVENTESFLQGRAANNVLLYGDSGTGKSSSIKAILNEYYGQGLRIIEVYKHQFCWLSDVLEQVQDRRYKFIIYMDDLSFEEFELEYKYLKAIIEGGLGRRPRNVLIYATSNRRHLIRERFSDKQEQDDELHARDTVQEKLSLVARFGVTIYYGSPDKEEFQAIVRELAERYQIHMPEEELLLAANRWELSHGGLSGRTASQFITYLLGKEDFTY